MSEKRGNRFIDLTGQRFGRLLAISYEVRNKVTWYKLRCDCGNETTVRGHSLRSGFTKSCGCLAVETARKQLTVHGNSNRPEYSCWVAMTRRCTDPKMINYPRYGGRGIRVCEVWQSFERFLADVGPRPSPEHTLNRINPDGNYEPGNVVWASPERQARNKRNSLIVTYRGASMPLIEACELAGKNYNIVRQRIRRYGWPVERALAA